MTSTYFTINGDGTHAVSVEPAEPETQYRDGAYTLACTCGEQATYRGFYFTQGEADAHRRYHARTETTDKMVGLLLLDARQQMIEGGPR